MAKAIRGTEMFAPMEVELAFAAGTVEKHLLLVRALYGNDSQINAIERAGARAALKVVRRNIRATSETYTGRLAKSARVYRARAGGVGVRVNKRGSYKKSGDGVRYGAAVHQGHGTHFGTVFYHYPMDPSTDAESAMRETHRKQTLELINRAKVLQGRLGPEAEAELRARLTRAGSKLAAGRAIGGAGRIQGTRAAATLQVLERSGDIEYLASTDTTALLGFEAA